VEIEQLPLYYLFENLRRHHGFILGVDDYLEALKLLQQGIMVGDRKELEQICSWLWAKSPEQVSIIQQRCEQITKNYHNHVELAELKVTKESNPPSLSPLGSPPLLPKRHFTTTESLSENSLENYDLDIEDKEYAQGVKLSDSLDIEDIPSDYKITRDYLPITPRQMRQAWRKLRQLVREGTPTELDIEGTIYKITQKGAIDEPVLQPPRINRSHLVLLIDQNGSMTPFHIFTKQLVATAQRGGQLKQLEVFYFRNYITINVFKKPNLFEAVTFREVLDSLNKRATVLIISDAGAARGTYQRDRVEKTREFLQQLRSKVLYSAWLNPMPKDDWYNSSAETISTYIPMFSMTRVGLNGAVNVVRAKYKKGEEL
jgi:uncharacterized protein with von Willebrand factor type A (vWA) domain